MDKIQAFYDELETHHKPKSDDPYEDRITHCYLEYNHKSEPHTFEVRGWGKLKNNTLTVYAVNWTITAGYCHIEINENNVDNYRIKVAYE